MTSANVNQDIFAGKSGDWELVVGLEIHAQVSSQSKLFSSAPVAHDSPPNSNVSLVDAAMPGMLPVVNRYVIEQAIKTGLGLKAKINMMSLFERKNYFYPDLPQGYQISQYEHPIVGNGSVDVVVDGQNVAIGIERLHLEQDAGKLIHDLDFNSSVIDLNRSGVALMEIVSMPDIGSIEVAKAYVNKVRSILRYLDTSDADMEKGNLRADVNISVRKANAELGTRCEIKNVNSIRFMGQAISYEAKRQIELLEAGGQVNQETRQYDASAGVTRPMRDKENANDYRYFPCPDLLPLVLEASLVDRIKRELPELPDEKFQRFTGEYGLSAYDAAILTADRDTPEYFERLAAGRDAKVAANWLSGSLFALLNKSGLNIADSPVSTDQLGSLIDLTKEGVISGNAAKEVFEIMWERGGDPRTIIAERNLEQITDNSLVEAAVDEVIAENPSQFARAKEKPNVAGWFVGQVMKKTGGKANPAQVKDLVMKRLAD